MTRGKYDEGVDYSIRRAFPSCDLPVFPREAVTGFIEEGGNVPDIGSIDQAAYSYLLNFEQLAGRNAQQVFTELEWE